MMVRVYNDNKHPYKEHFKGKDISIEPGKFVVMDYFEAIEFRGTYSPIKKDANDQPMPISFKMIRIDETPVDAFEARVDEQKCIACGYKSSSPKDLEEHTKAAHAHQHVTDPEAEAEIRRRPGRPPKDT